MFKNNKLNGYGRVIYDDTLTKYYQGYFNNNKKHGYGIKIYKDGRIEEGTF